jgi:hypothetical protein
MAACEATAEHILRVRTPTNASTTGVPGAWKYNFSRKGISQAEPSVSMICVPDPSEIDSIKKGLEDKGWYKAL